MLRDWRTPLLALAWLGTLPLSGHAQSAAGASGSPATPPIPPVLTLDTTPAKARLELRGPTDLAGVAPVVFPPDVTGQFSVICQGPGIARTQGVIFVPPRGQLPFILSEPPGLSALVILRGLNAPGVGDISCGHEYRGVTFALAGAGGTFGAVRSQLFYRDRLDETGAYAASRADDYRDARNAWLIYTGAVWGLSAIDYWIRPRFAMSETTPSQLTLAVPKVSRFGAVWRSLLVAGAGQEYGGHRTRAVVWLAAVLGCGAGYVVADYQVNYGETQLESAQEQVYTAGPSEIEDALLAVQQKQNNLQASEDLRTSFAIATLGFQALSLIDACIMQIALPVPSEPKISATMPLRPDGPAVAVSVRF
jgi:hypothetical protein